MTCLAITLEKKIVLDFSWIHTNCKAIFSDYPNLGSHSRLKKETNSFEWWGKKENLALLDGVYKHGFGNYEAL